MTRPRGTTLVEVLVVATVFLLLLGVVGGVLAPGLRAWRRADLRSELQGSALLVLHRVAADVAASTSRGIQIFPRTRTEAGSGDALRCDAVAIPLATDDAGVLQVDRLGSLEWCRLRIYYTRPERGEVWSAAFGAPGPLPDAIASALAAGRDLPPDLHPARCLARRVRTFAIRTTAAPFVIEVEAAAEAWRSAASIGVTPTLEALAP